VCALFDIPALNDELNLLRETQAAVNTFPLRERIVYLQQLQKAMDEIELRIKALEHLEQAQETLRQAAGSNARQWILKSLWDEVSNFGTFYSPPPLPTSFPDQVTAEHARRGLEGWLMTEAPLGIPAIPGVNLSAWSRLGRRCRRLVGLKTAPKPPVSPAERTEDAPKEIEKPSVSNQTGSANGGLTFLPGAFLYRGHTERLGGKPLEVLKVIYAAPGKSLTLRALQDKIWPDCDTGQETVRSAIMRARRALRDAMKAAKIDGPADPLPAADRGTNRTAWRLDLP
jgi:hypothetical protein